eukprot:102866-Pyramimonas_sp.AAC.1
MLNVGLAGREPIMCKQGEVIDIAKAEAQAPFAKDRRGILLGSAICKLHRKFLRGLLNQVIAAGLQDGQCGGVSGRSADFVFHFVASRPCAQFSDIVSAFVLSIDLKAALCTVLRQAIVRLPADEYDCQKALASLPVHPALDYA